MSKSIPVCLDCNEPVELVFVESTEQTVNLGEVPAEPSQTEDSYGVSEVEFRCPECRETVVLNKKQLEKFIKWGDENLVDTLWRIWPRYIKPYLENRYQTSDESEE